MSDEVVCVIVLPPLLHGDTVEFEGLVPFKFGW